ncbi:MAG: LpxD N-terminal domain-containing protein, partial [Burkholderiaceae bacterium]
MPASAPSLADLNAAVGRASGGRLTASIQGSADIRVDGLAPLASAGATDLAFLANSRYRDDALTTRAAAVVLSPDSAEQLAATGRPLPALVVVDQPYAWFAYAAQVLHPAEPVVPGVASLASVAPSAQVDPTACIEAGASVGEHAAI